MANISIPDQHDDVFGDKPIIKHEEEEDDDYVDDQDDQDYRDEDDKPTQEGDKSGRKYKLPRKSVAGRRLMRWNPSEDQFVLLTVEHVCAKQGINIPWDDVARHINDFLTGDAIKQHLAKLAKFREQVGQPVPQKLEKHPRRKDSKQNNTTAAAEGATGSGRKKSYKNPSPNAPGSVDDDVQNRGATLLWHPPSANKKIKNVKKPEAANVTQTVTPVSSPAPIKGSKKSGGDTLTSAPHKRTKSSGKRSRKTKVADSSDDDAPPPGSESPTKKQKVISLRPTVAVDYNEHLSDEDVFDAVQGGDDEGYDAGQESAKKQKTSNKKIDPKPSSHGNKDSVALPPPYFPQMVTSHPPQSSHGCVDIGMDYASSPCAVPNHSYKTPPVRFHGVEHTEDDCNALIPTANPNFTTGDLVQYNASISDVLAPSNSPAFFDFADTTAAFHATGGATGSFEQANEANKDATKATTKHKAKAQRKKSSTKVEIQAMTNTSTGKAEHVTSGMKAGLEDGQLSQTSNWSFEDGMTGIIPIADDTNRGQNSDNSTFHYNTNNINALGGLPMSILGSTQHTQQAQMNTSMMMSNPLHMGGGIDYPSHGWSDYAPSSMDLSANTSVTPAISNLGFPMQGVQFATQPNYSSSPFSSAPGSQERGAMISVGMDYMGNINADWDPLMYEQQHEDDVLIQENVEMEAFVQ